MTSLECRVGLLAPSATVPNWLSDELPRIGEIFSAASSDDIQLQTGQIVSIPRSASGGATALELQNALERLTANAATPGPPSNIGIIFADSFAPRPGVFGLMFDPGPGFGGLPDINRIPREGCAVFLQAIENRRAGTTPQETGAFSDPFEAETFFTAMHELGHVFNLWHSQSRDNYMWSSAKQKVAPQSDAGFNKPCREFLSQCSTAPSFVRPGGGPFGSRGSIGPTDVDLENAPASWQELGISIRLTDDEFFCFQPVELEIDVTIDNDEGQTAVELPDIIDPGYEAFVVFLEEPDGQRRILRSARRYCSDGRCQIITREKPFHRDLSVFGDANGFFFRRPGVHRIWVVLRFHKDRSIVSNVVECRVMARADSPREFSRWAPVLFRPDVARLLYHRSAPLRSHALELVKMAAPRFSKSNSKLGKELHYILGRLFDEGATRVRDPRRQRALRARAHRHFDRALSGSQLSRHRRRIVERVIAGQS